MNTLKPSNIRRGFANIGSTVTDFVGDVMPSARKAAKGGKDKRAQAKADNYETKRAAAFEKEKEKYERKQKRKAR